MPIQENEVTKQPEIEADAHKIETLLPIFHMAYGSHMDTLDHLQEQKAETQDQISKSENRIAMLEEKAARLEATNAMLQDLMDSGKLPGAVSAIIRANETKINAIHKNRIPKIENSIKKAENKISKLDDRIAVVRLKSEKLRSFSNVIQSFMIPNPQKRRELFKESMENLRNSSKGLLCISMNAEKSNLSKLFEQYEKSDSMAEKFKLGQKIEAAKSSISAMEAKIHKLENAPEMENANDHIVDKAIAQTEAEIENTDFLSNGDLSDFDKPIETVTLDSSTMAKRKNVPMCRYFWKKLILALVMMPHCNRFGNLQRQIWNVQRRSHRHFPRIMITSDIP